MKTRSLLTLQAQSQPLSKSPVITLCILSVLITQWQSSATSTITLVTTQQYTIFWHTTIVKTWILLTLQVHYQPLSKLPVTTHTILSVLLTQWKPSATNPVPPLMKQNCTPNPCTGQIKKSNHTNTMAPPYPPDSAEHVMERSATPTAPVERDKLDLSSLVPPKGKMESSFSWTYPFKSPT